MPDSLEEALRAIAEDDRVPLAMADIRKLIADGFITIKFGGGWMVNSKGREYLKQFKV